MIYLLLVLYQLKHFLCDYPLQGKYMLGKFKGGYDWVLPLLAHSAVHGMATFLIAYFVKPKSAFWLGLLDMIIHFTMDRIKASPNLLGRYEALSKGEFKGIASGAAYEGTNGELLLWKDNCIKKLKSNVYFWWALGLDQGVHHLTHYIIIWRLLS